MNDIQALGDVAAALELRLQEERERQQRATQLFGSSGRRTRLEDTDEDSDDDR
jgi:hypothetical protein